MHKTKEEILRESSTAFQSLSGYCLPIPDNVFFDERDDKWSIAQHVIHLTISIKATLRAYTIPRFLLRWLAGKPNRPGRTYDELVDKYKRKLESGGRARGKFVPGRPEGFSKQAIIEDWDKICARYINVIKNRWKDEMLDRYIAPHPLLGKITLRELCYFTLYHTQHHQVTISRKVAEVLICLNRQSNGSFPGWQSYPIFVRRDPVLQKY